MNNQIMRPEISNFDGMTVDKFSERKKGPKPGHTPLYLVMVLGLSLAANMVPNIAAASPLSCGVRPERPAPVLHCVAVADEVAIESVEINRGHCASPMATQEDIDDVRNNPDLSEMVVALEGDQSAMALNFFLPFATQLATFGDPHGRAVLRYISTPTKPLRYTQEINLYLFDCPNILEFEICLTDGNCWEWDLMN